MAEKAMDVYLNDHLGGAMLGSDLAAQIRDQSEGTPLGQVMTRIAAEIEADRETLLELMHRLDTPRNPVKQVTGWMAEKASRIKFSGATSGERDHGLFMALESLRLGVAGKKGLWLVLQQVRDDSRAAAGIDLARPDRTGFKPGQTLEAERMAAGVRALAKSGE